MIEGPWVARLSLSMVGTLDGLRLSGLEACQDDDEIWVRSKTASLPQDIPWAQVYEWHDRDALHLAGRRLPDRHLPPHSWQTMQSLLLLEPPAPGLPAQRVARTALALVPSERFVEPDLLETDFVLWQIWAESAPAVRLQRLRFAVLRGGQTFVFGNPLPPIPGQRYANAQRIFTPAGFTWDPPISPASLRDTFGLPAEDDAVLLADASWLRIPGEAWHPARRAIIRSYGEPAALQ